LQPAQALFGGLCRFTRRTLDREVVLELLGLVLLGQVARDLCKSVEVSRRRPQRREIGVRAKPLAILAHAPAFDLVSLVEGGSREQLLWNLRGTILGHEENLVRLTDDLFGGPPVDALGTFVPARDQAICVEHEDRVVAHAVDQQPKSFLARSQCIERAIDLLAIAQHDNEPVAIHDADRTEHPLDAEFGLVAPNSGQVDLHDVGERRHRRRIGLAHPRR
jgi:hypothetical protein